jgi:predicted membrane protein
MVPVRLSILASLFIATVLYLPTYTFVFAAIVEPLWTLLLGRIACVLVDDNLYW